MLFKILKMIDSNFTDSRKPKNYVISYEPLKLTLNHILGILKQCEL